MTRGVKTDDKLIAEIKHFYFVQPRRLSVKELSEHFPQISYYMLEHIFHEGKWKQEREDYNQKLAEESLRAILQNAAQQRAKEIQVVEAVWAKSAKKLLEAIEDGRYEPTPSDLDKITRLRAYLLGEADVRHGIMKEDRPEISDILRRISANTPQSGDIRRTAEIEA